MSRFNKIAVIIPAYNPDERLLGIMEDLYDAGFEKLIIVNDGSKEECYPVFVMAEQLLKDKVGGGNTQTQCKSGSGTGL